MNPPEDTAALPDRIADESRLEELLSRPTPEAIAAVGRLEGDLAIIGGGGKIGPSLVRMACRARAKSAWTGQVIVVDRFPDAGVRAGLEAAGARTVVADLLDERAFAMLPPAANVIYMVGMKFGTSENPSLTWAINALPPAYVVPRYPDARFVTFSTGCVYDFVPAGSSGSVETDPLTPVGEYANACVARERIFEHAAGRFGTPMVQLRLNYAVEMRYGVLVDVATAIAAGQPVDVTMGFFNCIWQGDVNAAALRLLGCAAGPPMPLNLTGPEKLSVRDVAARLADRMGREVRFTGAEAATALLSDASKAMAILRQPVADGSSGSAKETAPAGSRGLSPEAQTPRSRGGISRREFPTVPVETVIDWTADWVARGAATLGKPTHFQQRDGKY